MGIIKGCAKVIGSAVLGVTGVASTILKGMFDTTGIEVGSEMFGAAKDASFNGIRKIWDSDEAQKKIDAAQDKSYELEDSVRRSMANTAYQMAQTAKRNGDMEKYETYMDKYQELK